MLLHVRTVARMSAAICGIFITPACRGAYHRARIRATRWLMRATNYAGSLSQRPDDLHQLGMNIFVAAYHIAGLQRIALAVDAAYDAAGFAHQDGAGRHVPGLQIALPIPVEASRGDERHVERGGAEPAQAGDPVLDFGHLAARQLVVAAADMRQA